MFPDRRQFLALTGASLTIASLSAGPAAAASATRQFAVYLGRKKVGDSSVRLSRSGSRVDAEIEVSLHLSILGLINFDYQLSNRESWQDGVLQEMRSRTNNNGPIEYANASRTGRGLEMDGSGYQGIIEGNPATTSYFTSDFLERRTWINTQNGKVFTPSIGRVGAANFTTAEGETPCTRYALRDGVNSDLYYDSNFEWMGSSFSVAGRTARIAMSSRGGSLNRIWRG
ncbi:MAG: hypothetical protein GQ535_06545 [Rhodobacteraceae bacterium]|nr:hypothetical protein [Paracoccaceae bacterium]